MTGALIFFVAFLVAGVIARDWIVVVIAIVVWPIWIGLWGTGENWQVFLAYQIVASVTGAVTGIVAGRARWPKPPR